jgi:peptide/nickel transport system permease protein
LTDLLHTAEALTEVPPAGPTADEVEGLNVESASPFRMAMRRFVHHRMAMICLVVFTIIAVFIILAPWTARYPQDHSLPPIDGQSSFVSPRSQAWFGTDELNRDLYSRVIWGGRVSLFIGIAVALTASILGTITGAIAGYVGGWIDDILMRTTDLFLAFPLLVSLLVLRNMFAKVHQLNWLFGQLSSIRFIIVLLSLVTWMGVARIVRGVVLSLKEREFIEASRAIGSKRRRIVMRHLIPNAIGPILVSMTTAVVAAIVTESTLSFFGYGVDPSQGKSSWGNLLEAARGTVQSGYWWIALFPSIVFIITILCINFIGDGLRDAFDPKQDKGRA